LDEARTAGMELLKLEPTLTISGFKARYPGSASPQAGLFANALALSGVPN